MAKILSLSRFGSKKDLSNQEFKCVIRLLDDEEVLQVDFQVTISINNCYNFVQNVIHILLPYFTART